MMQKIGITGGIGTGKSTVCSVFKAWGIPVYDADSEAKALMHHDVALKERICSAFGEEAYQNGQLNRAFLAKTVFSDPVKLKQLNMLVHPRVGQHFQQWANRQAAQKMPYLLKEAALLFESGSYQLLDKVIVVSAPLGLRIARIRKRDPQRSETEIKNIIDRQMPENEKIQRADFVITNDEANLVAPQVERIHRQLLGE